MILKIIFFCFLFLLTFTIKTFSTEKIKIQDINLNEREELYLNWIFEEHGLKLNKFDLRKSTNKLLQKYKNFNLQNNHIDIDNILLTTIRLENQTYVEGFLYLNGYSHHIGSFLQNGDTKELWINRSQIFNKKNNSIKVLNIKNYYYPKINKLFSADTSYFHFIEDLDNDGKEELILGSNSSILFSSKLNEFFNLDNMSYLFRSINIFKNKNKFYLFKFEEDNFKIFYVDKNIKNKLINDSMVFNNSEIKPIFVKQHNSKLSINEYFKKVTFLNGDKKLYFTEINKECDRDIFPLDGIQHKNKLKLTNGKLNIFDFNYKITLTQINLGKIRCDSTVTLIPYLYKEDNKLFLYLSNTNYLYLLDLDKIKKLTIF